LRHQQRAQLRVVEARHLGAPVVVQLPTAADAAQGKDRHPCSAQRFHVAVDSTFGHFESRGEFSPGLFTVGLQHQQRRNESVSPHDQ
jgi:hypothetical protein